MCRQMSVQRCHFLDIIIIHYIIHRFKNLRFYVEVSHFKQTKFVFDRAEFLNVEYR